MGLLTVCASSTFEQLCSKEKLKALLTVTTTDDDDLMDDILDRVTEAAEAYIGRHLRKRTYLEEIPGYGDLYLILSQRPVQSITSILKGDAEVTSTDYKLTNPKAGMVYSQYGWSWTAGLLTDLVQHVVPGSELQEFSVEYVAGYVPSSSTSTELGVPRDIEAAVLEGAKAWYLGRKQNLNVTEKAVGDLRIRYANDQVGGGAQGRREPALPSRVESMLDPYRGMD